MHLLALCTSSENCLSSSFSHLLIELFVPLTFNFLNSLYNLDINPLLDEYLDKIFFPFWMLSTHSCKCFLCCKLVFSPKREIIPFSRLRWPYLHELFMGLYSTGLYIWLCVRTMLYYSPW
jgi:hypothetical protein